LAKIHTTEWTTAILTVLQRHHPELQARLRTVQNAFKP
jgi:hypothetical protein